MNNDNSGIVIFISSTILMLVVLAGLFFPFTDGTIISTVVLLLGLVVSIVMI